MATEPVTKTSNAAPDFRTSQDEIGCVLQDFRNRLELEFQKVFVIANTALNHPDVKGRLALSRRLQDACEDEAIKASPVVLSLANTMLSLLSNASIGADVAEVFDPLTTQAAKQAISSDKRKIAASKNAKPRAWVREKWKNRTDKGESKASFAKQHASLVKHEFDVSVTADTIARAWLPKDKR